MKRILLLFIACFCPTIAMENEDTIVLDFEEQCTIETIANQSTVAFPSPSWFQEWCKKNEQETDEVQKKFLGGQLLAFKAKINMADIEEFHERSYLIRKTFTYCLDAEKNLWCRVLLKKDAAHNLFTDRCVKEYNQIGWDDIKDDVHHWVAMREIDNSKI